MRTHLSSPGGFSRSHRGFSVSWDTTPGSAPGSSLGAARYPGPRDALCGGLPGEAGQASDHLPGLVTSGVRLVHLGLLDRGQVGEPVEDGP